MPDSIIEEKQGSYLISTDKSKLDIMAIHNYLSNESYWAKHIPIRIVKNAIEHSMCFGMYDLSENNFMKQIGFARVITDRATFGYLADVYVLDAHRKKGLSKWLMRFILAHPGLQGLRRFSLATQDAHGLYTQFGFKQLEQPDRMMEIKFNNAYYPAQE
jgi:GNAT superfamily N-acetyltransferase